MNRKEIVRFFKFLAVSVGAGVIQAVTFALLQELVGWTFWPCHLIALILSVIWNLTVNRKVTFKSSKNIPVALLQILAFYAVFTPATVFGGQWLVDIGWNSYLVEALTMVLNFVLEFVYQRFIVFRNSLDTAK